MEDTVVKAESGSLELIVVGLRVGLSGMLRVSGKDGLEKI